MEICCFQIVNRKCNLEPSWSRTSQLRPTVRYYVLFCFILAAHDKLARWGFRIHAAIDGATHYVVYLVVSVNKRMETIYDAYRQGVDKFGHPLMIRSDGAKEHNLIRADILQARPNTNAYRIGPSVHNQVIY
jgi:hypothetical protein